MSAQKKINIHAQKTCLLVNLLEGVSLPWKTLLDWKDPKLNVRFAASANAASEILNIDEVVAMVIFANEDSKNLQSTLSSFQHNVGYLPDFQAIVCDEPSPWFLASVFEYGIDKFFTMANWAYNTKTLFEDVGRIITDENSPEFKSVNLSLAVRGGNPDHIAQALKEIEDTVNYDYQAAFAKGMALGATNDFTGAAAAFSSATDMNKLARSAAAELGEALMQTGNAKKSIELFSKMEKTNPKSPRIKSNLAIAFMQTGNRKKADEYLAAATKLGDSENIDVLFAKVQIAFLKESWEEGIHAMDDLINVGAPGAAFFVRAGLKLARGGNQELAARLFRKAHKVVRPDLKYRISLNAALVSYQIGELDLALVYLKRCEAEIGSKIREMDTIMAAIQSAQTKINKK